MLAQLLPFLLAAAQPAVTDPVEDACYEREQSQLGLNACAADGYRRADAALNAQWAKASARFEGDAEARRLLLESQRAWLKYRDSQCEMAAFDNRGGSIWPLVNSGCLARLTRERTAELHALSEGLE